MQFASHDTEIFKFRNWCNDVTAFVKTTVKLEIVWITIVFTALLCILPKINSFSNINKERTERPAKVALWKTCLLDLKSSFIVDAANGSYFLPIFFKLSIKFFHT